MRDEVEAIRERWARYAAMDADADAADIMAIESMAEDDVAALLAEVDRLRGEVEAAERRGYERGVREALDEALDEACHIPSTSPAVFRARILALLERRDRQTDAPASVQGET